MEKLAVASVSVAPPATGLLALVTSGLLIDRAMVWPSRVMISPAELV